MLERPLFNTLAFVKAQPKYQDKTISEMIDHEEHARSATKRHKLDLVERANLTEEQERSRQFAAALLGIFDRNLSEATLRTFRDVYKQAKEIEAETADPIALTIFAKALEDYAENQAFVK